MKMNLQTNTWIATLSAAALAVAYLLLMFLPNERAMKRLCEQVRAKQDQAASAGSIAAAIHRARDELQRTHTYNAAWSRAAPPKAELAAVLGRLDALAVASGATPTRFDPEPAVPMEKLHRVRVAVGSTGSFAQIARFLYDLEGLPLAVWIDRLKIDVCGKDREDVQCELELGIFADNPGDLDEGNLAG